MSVDELIRDVEKTIEIIERGDKGSFAWKPFIITRHPMWYPQSDMGERREELLERLLVVLEKRGILTQQKEKSYGIKATSYWTPRKPTISELGVNAADNKPNFYFTNREEAERYKAQFKMFSPDCGISVVAKVVQFD